MFEKVFKCECSFVLNDLEKYVVCSLSKYSGSAFEVHQFGGVLCQLNMNRTFLNNIYLIFLAHFLYFKKDFVAFLV